MTEEQHIQLVEAGNDFWNRYSRLVAEVVSLFPPEMEDEVLSYLQDRSSAYGSKYRQHVERKPHV